MNSHKQTKIQGRSKSSELHATSLKECNFKDNYYGDKVCHSQTAARKQ